MREFVYRCPHCGDTVTMRVGERVGEHVGIFYAQPECCGEVMLLDEWVTGAQGNERDFGVEEGG